MIELSITELLARASLREPMDKHVDSLSGAGFERVVIAGDRYVVKYLDYATDWLARALGDRDCFVLTMARAGLLDELPDCVDHTIVGAAREDPAGRVALLMHDIGEYLVPPGEGLLPQAQHRRFLEHMAAFHARFWGFEDSYGLLPLGNRYTALTAATGVREAAAGGTDPVPRALPVGWRALREAAPQVYEYVEALAEDPTPLVDAFAQTPATFIHGDWKAGNLGSQPDGRTILLDWGWPGRAGPLVDLAWYLAVNCDRLPTLKEEALSDYRNSLERYGIATNDWWDRQRDLALLGGFVQLGWSKAGDRAELDWWLTRVSRVAKELLG